MADRRMTGSSDGGPSDGGSSDNWAVDVGNSRVKAGRFSPEGVLLEVHAGAPDEPLPTAGRVYVLSVSPRHLARFLAAHDGSGAAIVRLEAPLPIELRVAAPGEVGLDRIANAAAAFARAAGAALVVDVGTAITVDAVAGDGAFLGGAIAPGPACSLAGLREGAPHLPDPAGGDATSARGERTVDAMAGALRFGFAGLIDRLAEEVACDARLDRPRRFLTGGGAPLVAPALRLDYEPVDHLTLEGILELGRRVDGVAERWTRASPS